MKTNILSPGKKINHRYTIISVISEGASAVTYKAKDHICNDICCIKELLPKKISNNITRVRDFLCFIDSLTISAQVASDIYQNYLTIFKREKNLLERIQTKGTDNEYSILKLRDYFVENGFCYNVYETAKCKSLAEIIRNTPLTTDNFKFYLDIISKLLCALNDIHANDVLHLDIAPDNVLLMSESQNTVRIIDFGSALENYDRKKQPDNFIYSSKEGFSPLELIEYSKANTKFVPKLSPATDIFSVAAILFKIIVGRTIDCSDYLVDDWKQILRSKLPFRSSKEYDIQENIIRILECGLNNSMEKRYQSANKMLDEIEELKKQIDLAPEKIKKEKHKQKANKRGIIVSILLPLLICLYFLFVTFSPNIMSQKAYNEIEKGNRQKAYEQMLEVYDIYMSKPRLLHPAYSEEKLKTLAWHIYQQRELETTVEFEENVIQAVKTHDNNQIIALLENSEIVAKNLSVDNTTVNAFSVPNSEGVLSNNGMYYATINNNKTLEIYHIGNKKLYEFKNIENFALDNNYLLMLYSNGSLEAVSLDTRESISYDDIILESFPTKYSANAKTFDYKMQQNKMSYIDTHGNVIVIDLTTKEKYKHTPETKKALKFVQLSENLDFSTVQVSDLFSVVYEFDYITNEKALALSTLEYSYFASPESNWRISQKWTDKTSLEDRYISIEGNKVKINLIATDTTTRIRFMRFNGNAEKEITKLVDCSDLDYPFLYDYDRQKRQFYLTNIETGAERNLPFNSDANISEIGEFIVHDSSLCITTKDLIIFCEIKSDSIKELERIKLSSLNPNGIYYSFSLDKKMFAYLENKTVKIYKYSNNIWSLYDTIKPTDDSFVYNIKFSSDNSKLCIEYCIEKERLSRLVFFEDTNKGFVQYRSDGFGKCQMQEISDDMSHAFAYLNGNSDVNGIGVIEVDCEQKKQTKYVINTNSQHWIQDFSFAISGSLITTHCTEIDSINPRYSVFDNEEEITKNANSLSRPIQVSKEEIAYIERNNNRDSLIKYNVTNGNRTIIPLPEYGFNAMPNAYELWFLKDGYISVSALYISDKMPECLCVNYLFEDLSLDKLLLKCESLYR